MYLAIFKNAYKRFNEVNAHSLGAALSYFAIFSLVPLLSILILIVGLFLSHEFIVSQVLIAFESVLGSNVAQLLSSALQNPIHYSENAFVDFVAVGAFIFAVLTLTSHLQHSLDIIFGFEKEETHFLYITRGPGL